MHAPLIFLFVFIFILFILSRHRHRGSRAGGIPLVLFFVLSVIGIGLFYRLSESPQSNRWNRSGSTQTVQISHNKDKHKKIGAAASDVRVEDQSADLSVNPWPDEEQTSRAEAIVPGVLSPSNWIGLLVTFALLAAGSLALIIALLSNPKTRLPGIIVLVVGSIVILPILGGLFWFGSWQMKPNSETAIVWPAQNIRPMEQINMAQNPGAHVSPPPGYENSEVPPPPPGYINQPPNSKPAKSPPTPASPEPNSKQIVNAYESAISYYRKAISQPLNLEIKDELKDKVSTLKINVQDIGQVTISGSSFLINSIGQALAKAMTERMKDGNQQIDITAENTQGDWVAKAAGTGGASEPAPAEASSKIEKSPKESPAKDVSAATAKAPAPIAKATGSAPAVKAVSTEGADIASVPNLPEWVGKRPFLWQAGKGMELPDYYKIVHPKTADGDAYIMSVSTDPYTTMQECEAKVPEVLQSAVDQYVDKSPELQQMGHVRLSPEQLRQLVVAEYEELWQSQSLLGPMPRIHLLLTFDKNAITLIKDAMKERLFTDHATIAGAGFIGLWLLLAVIWGYLKLDLATKGAYHKRLTAAAVFTILMVSCISTRLLVYFVFKL